MPPIIYFFIPTLRVLMERKRGFGKEEKKLGTRKEKYFKRILRKEEEGNHRTNTKNERGEELRMEGKEKKRVQWRGKRVQED